GLNAAIWRLSELDLPVDAVKAAAEIVNRRATSGLAMEGEMSIRVGEFAYPFHGDPQEFQINAMHAAISGDDKLREKLGMDLKLARWVLWGQLLQWQSHYFGVQSSKRLTALLNSAQAALAKEVLSGAATAKRDLEIYALLEALKQPADSVSFRIALPNLKLIRED